MLIHASNTGLEAFNVSVQPHASDMLKMAAVIIAKVPDWLKVNGKLDD